MNIQTFAYPRYPNIVTYKVRKRFPVRSISYKTVQIAKKIVTTKGQPKPLSCEEDFVLELNNTPQEFLRPVSGFYKYPQLAQKNRNKSEIIRPRNIVGPLETYKKVAEIKNTKNNLEMVKKNKSMFTFGKEIIKFGISAQDTLVTEEAKEEKFQRYEKKKPTVYEKQVMYWNKINKNLEKRVSLRVKKFRKSISLWQKLD